MNIRSKGSRKKRPSSRPQDFIPYVHYKKIKALRTGNSEGEVELGGFRSGMVESGKKKSYERRNAWKR
jgi:hypothetical protein